MELLRSEIERAINVFEKDKRKDVFKTDLKKAEVEVRKGRNF